MRVNTAERRPETWRPKATFTLTRDAIRQLEELARAEGLSRSTYIVKLIGDIYLTSTSKSEKGT
jgi:hypothetical protein